MLEQMAKIVRDAGALAARTFGKLGSGDVQFKGEVDLVTHVDREVEEFLRAHLGALCPEAVFVGEETSGPEAAAVAGLAFVVDPVDGTANYVHGLPHYSVSVALRRDGQPLLGAVFAPALDVLYTGERGRGAWRNGQRLRVSSTARLLQAVAATGFACVRQRIKPDNLPIFTRAVYALQGVRRFGSAAVDLCYVAEGVLDLYWEMNLRPWDLAAGVLILQEAGGRVSDFAGGNDYERQRQLVASNGLVHDEFLALIAAALDGTGQTTRGDS